MKLHPEISKLIGVDNDFDTRYSNGNYGTCPFCKFPLVNRLNTSGHASLGCLNMETIQYNCSYAPEFKNGSLSITSSPSIIGLLSFTVVLNKNKYLVLIDFINKKSNIINMFAMASASNIIALDCVDFDIKNIKSLKNKIKICLAML